MDSRKNDEPERSKTNNLKFRIKCGKEGTRIVKGSSQQETTAVDEINAKFSQMRPVAITTSVAPQIPLYPPGTPGQQFMHGHGPPAMMMPPQAQFSQMRPVAITPSVAPQIPLYPPGTPGLGQQFMYGQGPPAMMPPQAGFGYQQQFVPGMGPGGGPMPSYFVPIDQLGQQGQCPGSRRVGPGQQAPQQVPMMQQQEILGASKKARGHKKRKEAPAEYILTAVPPGLGGSSSSGKYVFVGSNELKQLIEDSFESEKAHGVIKRLVKEVVLEVLNAGLDKGGYANMHGLNEDDDTK